MENKIDFSESIYPANALVTEFGVDQGEAMKAIDHEAADIQARASKRIRETLAIEMSYKRVRAWILESAEYAVPLSWAELAHFTSSHRPACVWAVLTGKALGVKKGDQ